MTYTPISQTIKTVMKSLYSEKAEHEALLSYDFKLTDLKTSLMRLCFSPLANWTLFVWILILNYNPFRYQHQILGDIPGLLSFIYSPQWATGIAIGIIFSYFMGLIMLPIALVLYFVSQAEIHTILGSSIIAGVFLGRALKYLKLSIKLEGKIKFIFIWFALVQIASLVIAVFINLWIYQYMSVAGYFSRTLYAYRFEFIAISLAVIYMTQMTVNSIWGHFYSRKYEDPAILNIFYSTAMILRRLWIGKTESRRLKLQVETKHSEQKNHLNDPSTAYVPKNILQTAQIEKDYLDRALRFWSSPVPK